MIYFHCEKCNSVMWKMELDEDTQDLTLKHLANLAKKMLCSHCIIQTKEKENDND